MIETIDELYDRVYIHFVHETVLVWNSNKDREDNKEPVELWTLNTFNNYLNYLKGKNR